MKDLFESNSFDTERSVPPGDMTVASPGLWWMRMVALVTRAHFRYLSSNWVVMYGFLPKLSALPAVFVPKQSQGDLGLG